MEIRQLRYFLMLADELHFKRAAEKLFIVQPALTKQIQDLEAELGVILFDRNKRNVKLSVAGVFFRNEIKKMFQGLEKAKNEVKKVAFGQIGELKIGYVGSCIHTFLPGLLATLNVKFPEIHTYLSEMTSASQFLAIQKEELDIAFLRNPPLNKRFKSQLVFQENFALVLPQNHFLNESNFESMAQLAHEKFILPTKTDGKMYQQLQWSICEDAGFVPKIAHETVHGHTTLKLVESGLGLSLIPISFSNVSNAAIKFIELKNIHQKAEITAFWNPDNENPSLKVFLDMIEYTVI